MPKNENNNIRYKQQQEQINLLAHNKILAFENFRYLLESLEEYIEKAGYYRDFKSKRQLRNITIPKEKNYSLDNLENLFQTKLVLFVTVLGNDTPDSTKKEIQQEFYKWINIVGIDANNCPDEKLKHFLLETNSILEGDSEKIINQAQEYLDKRKQDSPTSLEDMESLLRLFSSVQEPMNKKREEADFYKDKKYFEVEVKDKFEANAEQGQRVFDQLTGEIANKHNDFKFFENQTDELVYNFQQVRRNLIESIKQKIGEWKIMELFVSHHEKQTFLIHKSVQRNERKQIILDPEKTKRKDEFTNQEWSEIQQVWNNYQVIREEKRKNYASLDRNQLVELVLELEDNKRMLEIEINELKSRNSQDPEVQMLIDGKESILRRDTLFLDTVGIDNNNNNNLFPTVPVVAGSVGVVALLGLIIAYQVKKNKSRR